MPSKASEGIFSNSCKCPRTLRGQKLRGKEREKSTFLNRNVLLHTLGIQFLNAYVLLGPPPYTLRRSNPSKFKDSLGPFKAEPRLTNGSPQPLSVSHFKWIICVVQRAFYNAVNQKSRVERFKGTVPEFFAMALKVKEKWAIFCIYSFIEESPSTFLTDQTNAREFLTRITTIIPLNFRTLLKCFVFFKALLIWPVKTFWPSDLCFPSALLWQRRLLFFANYPNQNQNRWIGLF